MRKLITIFIVALYGLGSVLFPYVDVSHLRDIYAQCQAEDTDMDIADFLLEHMLSLPDIDDLGDQDSDNGEHPHQAYNFPGTGQTPVLVSPSIYFSPPPQVFDFQPEKLISNYRDYLPEGVSSAMLRPPINFIS